MTTSTPKPDRGVDAATFIQDRIRHGEHVVTDSVDGAKLLHPGCATPCEFTGLALEVDPRDRGGYYVAEISGADIVPRGDA